jgi:hypothetical protein
MRRPCNDDDEEQIGRGRRSSALFVVAARRRGGLKCRAGAARKRRGKVSGKRANHGLKIDE